MGRVNSFVELFVAGVLWYFYKKFMMEHCTGIVLSMNTLRKDICRCGRYVAYGPAGTVFIDT